MAAIPTVIRLEIRTPAMITGQASGNRTLSSCCVAFIPIPLADSTTAGLLRLHADRSRIVIREAHLRERWATEHPGVASAVVPALSTDVHDLDGLRRVGELLADG